MYSDGRTLIKRLRRGKAAREGFTNSHISKGIAFQIRAIRDRLNWSQEKLAEEAGMTQNAISRLESPEYGKPTLTTLKRLAAAFDVALIVRFVPFSELVDWVTSTPRINKGISPNNLAAAPFAEEDRAGTFDVAPIPVTAPTAYRRESVGTAGGYIPLDSTATTIHLVQGTGAILIRKPVQSADFAMQQLTATGARTIVR